MHLLWFSSKKSRKYIIANYDMLLRNYFTHPSIVKVD
jgi:hypothetical protein